MTDGMYPFDEELLAEAAALPETADIKSRDLYEKGYRLAVLTTNGYEPEEKRLENWKHCLSLERSLRAVIAEAKAGRVFDWDLVSNMPAWDKGTK